MKSFWSDHFIQFRASLSSFHSLSRWSPDVKLMNSWLHIYSVMINHHNNPDWIWGCPGDTHFYMCHWGPFQRDLIKEGRATVEMRSTMSHTRFPDKINRGNEKELNQESPLCFLCGRDVTTCHHVFSIMSQNTAFFPRLLLESMTIRQSEERWTYTECLVSAVLCQYREGV